MWPADRPDLRARVAWATVLLVVAKLTLVVVPYSSNGRPTRWPATSQRAARRPFMLPPGMLVIAYNVIRIVQGGFSQLRDALFARVGQYAVRILAFRTSCICTNCRCAFIWSGAPAACRGSSSARCASDDRV
jgi:ATP-binding cassette subfamily B protein